jgi:hypothetical protein
MIQITAANRAATARPRSKTTGYKRQIDAKMCAVREIGPHARHGFEFETWKADGLWFWRECDEVRPDNEAQAKANGGNRRLLRATDEDSVRRPPIAAASREAIGKALARQRDEG